MPPPRQTSVLGDHGDRTACRRLAAAPQHRSRAGPSWAEGRQAWEGHAWIFPFGLPIFHARKEETTSLGTHPQARPLCKPHRPVWLLLFLSSRGRDTEDSQCGRLMVRSDEQNPPACSPMNLAAGEVECSEGQPSLFQTDGCPRAGVGWGVALLRGKGRGIGTKPRTHRPQRGDHQREGEVGGGGINGDERRLDLGCTPRYAGDVSQNCTFETCIILLTNVTPICSTEKCNVFCPKLGVLGLHRRARTVRCCCCALCPGCWRTLPLERVSESARPITLSTCTHTLSRTSPQSGRGQATDSTHLSSAGR